VTGTAAIGHAGVALVALGSGAGLWWLLVDPTSRLRGWFADYVRFVDRQVRLLMLRRSALWIARVQLIAAVGLLAAAAVLDRRLGYGGLLALVLPPVWLRRQVGKRRERIEQQLDGWLLMLANMLKATSSLVDAVRGTVKLTAAPISQEIDLVVKEVELGSSLDVALRSMVARIDSAMVSAAVTAILVGRRSGGDLPRVLERSAGALREIHRLEGVVRSKTAQARMQLIVMALFPPGIYYGLRAIDPHFFDPLVGFWGVVVYGAASLFWIVGILVARKILDVDV
jgi:tight adherence protein B